MRLIADVLMFGAAVVSTANALNLPSPPDDVSRTTTALVWATCGWCWGIAFAVVVFRFVLNRR